MKICWDNLEGIKLTSNNVFLKNNRDSYVLRESCKRCGEPYLDLKFRHSDYCCKSCSFKERRYSEEVRKNMSIAKKGKKTKHGAYIKGLAAYETYASRLWADEVELIEIEGVKTIKVRCSGCGEYFVPTISNVIHRVSYLEGKQNCESRFYCSDGCRSVCPVFGRHKYPKGFKSSFEYTTKEYEIWHDEVMNRADHKCEYCGGRATDVHHMRPKVLEPFFALDPDYGIACCEECHYKYGHKDECASVIIANTICL